MNNDEMKKRMLSFQKSEITEHFIYLKLAEIEKLLTNPPKKQP